MDITIWFKKDNNSWACGIGDGVHDGLYVTGFNSKGDAAIAFIKKLNADTGFCITETSKLKQMEQDVINARNANPS